MGKAAGLEPPGCIRSSVALGARSVTAARRHTSRQNAAAQFPQEEYNSDSATVARIRSKDTGLRKPELFLPAVLAELTKCSHLCLQSVPSALDQVLL